MIREAVSGGQRSRRTTDRLVEEAELFCAVVGALQQAPLRRFLQPVLDQQVQVVALIQDLALDVGVELVQPPNLAVLLRYEFLVEGRDLDVEIEVGQVEVGREPLGGNPVPVPIDIERRRFVGPRDPIEVEKPRELALAVMCEVDGFVGKEASTLSSVGRSLAYDLTLPDSYLFVGRNVTHVLGLGAELAQRSLQFVTDATHRHDGAEHTLAVP